MGEGSGEALVIVVVREVASNMRKGGGGGSPRRFVGVASSPRRLVAPSHPLWVAPGGILIPPSAWVARRFELPRPLALPWTLHRH